MASDVTEIEVDMPLITVSVKMPRLFWLREWIAVKLLVLAGIVAGIMTFEIVEGDDDDATVDDI